MDYTTLSKQQLIELLMERERVTQPDNVYYNCLRKYAKKEQEHFIVILLDGSNQVIKTQVVTIGTLNAAPVHPREVFRPAIKYNAAAIIIAHNHPSGNTTPSQEDINATHRILQASEIIGIRVLDHLIFSSRGYTSLSAENLLH